MALQSAGDADRSLLGIPATGKPITITGISIDRFAGGQIVERWSQLDTVGLLRQLGALSVPGYLADQRDLDTANACRWIEGCHRRGLSDRSFADTV